MVCPVGTTETPVTWPGTAAKVVADLTAEKLENRPSVTWTLDRKKYVVLESKPVAWKLALVPELSGVNGPTPLEACSKA